MRVTVLRVVVVWGGVMGLVGCGDHLVYVSETDLGVSVTAAGRGTPKVAVGYDRETFAVVPRVERADGKGAEAMSLVSVSNVDVTGLEELVFNHYIVTGEAAERAVRDPEGLRRMREAIGLGEVEH